MYRNYHCLEMVLLLLLSHFHWNGPSWTSRPCSRNRSLVVHFVIQKKILPIFHRYKIPLSLNCPFNVKRDFFWWPNADENFREKYWQCPTCQETFTSEDDLIHHWDTDHSVDAQQIEDSICMEMFCDIFRCDIFTPNSQVLESKHYWRKSFLRHENDINKLSCSEKDMFLLHEKCMTVIKQCLYESIASLSVKDFKDIEEELDMALCSYLTCQKYWDESLTEVQQIPALFYFAFISILIGIFYMCYYIVWLLVSHYSLPIIKEPLCNGDIHANKANIKFRTKSQSSGQRSQNSGQRSHNSGQRSQNSSQRTPCSYYHQSR